MIAQADIIVDDKMQRNRFYFRVKLGRVEVRSQLHYKSVRACKAAIKKLCEDLKIDYSEEQ